MNYGTTVDVNVKKKLSKNFPFFLCLIFIANVTSVDLLDMVKQYPKTIPSDYAAGIVGSIVITHFISWVLCTNLTSLPMMVKRVEVSFYTS